MTTNFGKELRKLRIEKEENLIDMGKKLNISISYLSCIENGTRSIPDDLIKKITAIYKLSKEEINILEKAKSESISTIKIDLSNLTSSQRELFNTLSRNLDSTDDSKCNTLIKIITGGDKNRK